jgi:Family of unknown function (DUF5681)
LAVTGDQAPENTGRDQAGRFLAGRSGNPAGRPRGSRHEALEALDAIGAEAAKDVLLAVVEAARGGDIRAADILLRRLWPERKSRPIKVHLPAMETATDIGRALGAIVEAVSNGELTPDEGQAIAAMLEGQRRAIETMELERRVEALEARHRQERGGRQ